MFYRLVDSVVENLSDTFRQVLPDKAKYKVKFLLVELTVHQFKFFMVPISNSF